MAVALLFGAAVVLGIFYGTVERRDADTPDDSDRQ